MAFRKYFLVTLLQLLTLKLSLSTSFEYDQAYLKSPCDGIANDAVSIRVKDEIGQLPDILLGHGALRYYMISPKTPGEVVIECSTRVGNVEWIYNGVGASSGFKIVNTRWSYSDVRLKAHCYSSALVLTNITDQLTGEYICRAVDMTTINENSFRLFVPQTAPTYYSEGEVINVTVPHWTDASFESVILPCVTKDKTENVTLYKFNETTGEFRKQILGIGLRFDPYLGFHLTPTREFLTSDSKIGVYECRFGEKENKTLLKVNLVLQSDEKVVPEKSEIRATAPYLSWTTRSIPKLKVDPPTSQYTVYQRYYTKKDYEEDSVNASIFRLGSIHLLNETEGSIGEVILYNGNKLVEDGTIKKWKYFIINETTEQEAGLKYEYVDFIHSFTCTSLSDKKPKIVHRELSPDGIPIKNVSNIVEKDCGTNCVFISTEIPQGVVTCIGDGIDETLRYPPNILTSSRPYFVERGNTVYVTSDDVVVTLPCLVNTLEPGEVYLFKKVDSTYVKIWSADDKDTPIEFYATWGFHLDTSYPILSNPSGKYICTSNSNLNDRSDMVTVIVRQPPNFRTKLYPEENKVFGRPPLFLRWESEEDLEIKEKDIGMVTFFPVDNEKRFRHPANRWWDSAEEDEMNERHRDALNTGEYLYRGKIEISSLNSTIQEVTLIKKEDGTVVHTWMVHNISETVEKQSGLIVDTNEDENGEHQAIAICRSKSSVKPKISYIHCQNPKTCSLMKNCMDKNCNVDNYLESIMLAPESCKEGCTAVIIKSVATNGLLNISCVGDGVSDFTTISEVFFKEDIHWDSSKEDGYLYLYVNLPPSTDQNPQQEVQNIAPNLSWEIGDAVLFSCAAAPFLFSNGVKWAVEMSNGSLIFQNDSAFDPQFKYSGSTQVLSSMNLLLDSFDIKKVWCFAPLLGSPSEWKNISQPVFIREEAGDLCHENQPTIRIINVYPPPSKLEYQFLDPRLDNKDHFVLPNDVKQFAVELTAPEPVEWIFTGFAAGPSATPLVQQDRHVTDFYNETTYCYTSRLLLNLRNKNSNDTGRYIAKPKTQYSNIYASFYLFVPSENSTYLLLSGTEINETWVETAEFFSRPFLPCLLNDPNQKVLLYKKRDEGEYEKVEMDDSLIYDPKAGFILNNNNGNRTRSALGTYKCVVEGHESDFLVVNVVPPEEKPKGLKQEKVGEFQVFTCKSENENNPAINFTELTSEGIPVEKSEGFIMKECPGGCMILMTRASYGIVNCKGDGIDETVRFPVIDGGTARNTAVKTGLWYDSSDGVFKCQSNTQMAPKLVAVTCRRPNECEIMQSLLNTDGDTSQAIVGSCGEGCTQLDLKKRGKSYWPPNWFSAFIRCRSEGDIEVFSQYFSDKNEIIQATLDSVERFRKIRLDIATIRKQGSSVLATFRCFANRYFYSRGFQWGLEFKNGTIDIQEIIPREVEVQNFSAVMSEVLLDFDENVFKAVWCFAPFLETPRWANASVNTPIDDLIFDL